MHDKGSALIFLRILLYCTYLVPVTVAFSSLPAPSTTFRSHHSPLGGIKGFRAWLESQFPESIVDIKVERASQTFDHVLIDMNQLLHISLRKSRSYEHGLVLMMKELDACLKMASPRCSLVLAIDGPPAAAKLATQRKRRLNTLTRAVNRKRQSERLLNSNNKRVKSSLLRRKIRFAASELRTLAITPATDIMKKAESALEYWAWQRLLSRHNILSLNNVSIHISKSTVPGEGEVKLLEWFYSAERNPNDTVAIIGGDSDLVLEALTIPITKLRNVFVVLPETGSVYRCVSVWEMTRTLHHQIPYLTLENTMKVRNDIVVLLMLHGNDYLPKLRGSSFLKKIFRTYLRIHEEWNEAGRKDDAYLVDPDSLEYNSAFASRFFSALAASTPILELTADNDAEFDVSPVHILHTYVDAGYLPGPVLFQMERDSNEYSDEEGDEGGPDARVHIHLGKPQDTGYYTTSISLEGGQSMQEARKELASIVLSVLMEEERPTDEDETSTDFQYEWDLRHPVEGNVEEYLYGLLWTLQTYQEGACGDYGYNYGRRVSPSPQELADLFSQAESEGREVSIRSLASRKPSKPILAGVSCLAALPSAAQKFLPDPYRQLDADVVEKTYAECMSKEDNVFDISRFEDECYRLVESEGISVRNTGNDNHWVVISKSKYPQVHPAEPPRPFAENFSPLRRSDRIRVQNYRAVTLAPPRQPTSSTSNQLAETSIEQVPFFIPYSTVKRTKRKALRSNMRKEKDAEDGEQVSNDGSVPTTKDGISALSCLKQLQDTRVIESMKWHVQNDGDVEVIRLEITMKTPKVAPMYEETRLESQTRQHVKHRIAAQVLTDVTGPAWFEKSYKDIGAVLSFSTR